MTPSHFVKNIIIVCGGILVAMVTAVLTSVFLSLFIRDELKSLLSMDPEVAKAFIALVREKFPAIIGLPIAALFSLFIVVMLRITTGPIEFEAEKIKIKGAAGPVIFWVICFVSIALSIKLLW